MNEPVTREIRGDVAVSTVTSKRIAVWDGWRGIAIAMVLCGHFYDIKWLWEDRMGVDIFFVLSGMLMSIILFDKRQSLKDFYIRRLSRIYPTLLVFVLAMFGFAALTSLPFAGSEVISSLVFLRTYFPAEPGIWDTPVTVAHLWSLNIEEHAYLFLSFLTLLMVNRRHIAHLLLLLTVASIALSFYKYFTLPAEAFTQHLIRTESSVVFIFVSAAYGLLYRQARWSVHPLLPLVCFLAAILCYAESAPTWLIFAVAPILLAITVNHLEQLPDLISRLLSFAPLRYIGLWSYSVYLWQQFFYEYSWKIPGGPIVAVVLAIAVGAGSFYFLENPVRHWINAKWSANPRYRTSPNA